MALVDVFKAKPVAVKEVVLPDVDKIAALIEKYRRAPLLPLKEVLPLLGGRRFIIIEAGERFSHLYSVSAVISEVIPDAIIYQAITPKPGQRPLFDGLSPASTDISPDMIALTIHISTNGTIFSARHKVLPYFTQFTIQDEE